MIKEDSPETARHLGSESGRRLSAGHNCQSEPDWAYAKRALAPGDEMEEIIRRIADFRSADKKNPEYYARHTVEKAQAELAKQKETESSPDVQPTQARKIGVDH